jgi:ribosome-associated toxin RatA of RatAB toxin-antitoxin module
MTEHSASVTVNAPVHQVYELFTHFNDFPKFMSFIQEVTYYDDERSHWVVHVGRTYEWDAVNVDWIPDQQVGWRSFHGLHNSGKVKFRALGPERTDVDVYIQYEPPSGALGQLGEALGVGSYFTAVLQKDLQNFARMVEDAPAGSLDPMSSHYLFHDESAASKGFVTPKQQEAMSRDPMMSPEALAERQTRIGREAQERQQKEAELVEVRRQKLERERQIVAEQRLILAREAEKRRKERQAREEAVHRSVVIPPDPRYTYAARAYGLGDRDGLRARTPNFTQAPMTSRRPAKPGVSAPPRSTS